MRIQELIIKLLEFNNNLKDVSVQTDEKGYTIIEIEEDFNGDPIIKVK